MAHIHFPREERSLDDSIVSIGDGALAVDPDTNTLMFRSGGVWRNNSPSGNWAAPVATVVDLPALGNVVGDTRVVFTPLAIYVWTADNLWTQLSSGGSVPTPGLPANLFIGASPPDPATLTINSLYIAVDGAGAPLDVSSWQVYTGFADGNGGNLFVQETAPTPDHNALWVPLNPDGTAKYLDQWVVFIGGGPAAVGAGNQNLFFTQNEPVAPPTGSFFIPLNPDGTPKLYDQWEVYA